MATILVRPSAVQNFYPTPAATPPAFTIDRGVPLPPKAAGRSRVGIYPFTEMEVGDSFFIATTAETHTKQLGRASAAAAYYRKDGFRFATRRVEGGVRIWRVA